MTDQRDEWIVVTTFRDSRDTAYLGWSSRDESRSNPTLTPWRGNAFRFQSENHALERGYFYRDELHYGDFRVECIVPPMGFSGSEGTGGRAG
jgi:hypothetical protein